MPSRAAAALSAVLVMEAAAKSMDCGPGVELCGSFTLESGFGSGVYHSSVPEVHGLWPAVGEYGSSKCIAPQDSADPTVLYPCYKQANQSEQQLRWFQNHEWEKHGTCAGVKSADDFFNQVCALSSAPLAAMTGANFQSMVDALTSAGYPIWDVDEENDQIELSVCAQKDGRWKLAKASDFGHACGGGAPPAPGPSPAPDPKPHGGECVPGRQGPPCDADIDCSGLHGCVRCAHSGYCTDQLLAAALQWLLM